MEPWVIALVSAISSGSFAVGGSIYWFGRNTPTIADLHELRDLAIAHRDEIKAEIAAERRDVGEGLSALRQKINDVELEAAKVYVRRESWHQAMNQLQETFGKSDQAAEQRMLRIEEKIDRLADRMARPT